MMRLPPIALVVLVAACEEDLVPDETDTTVSYSTCVWADGAADDGDFPLPGVAWSVLEHPEVSATTDEDGCMELGPIPRDERLILTWTKDNYGSRQRTVQAGQDDFSFVSGWWDTELMLTPHVRDGFAAGAFTIDWSKPALAVYVRDAYDADAFLPDIELVARSGTPCYRRRDLALGCATPAENAGVGRLFNLAAGTIDVTIRSSDGRPLDCAASGSDWQMAWPTAEANTYSLALRDGVETLISVDCSR